MLGSKTQRGLTQMTLDVLFSSIGHDISPPSTCIQALASLDRSEAHILAACDFLDSLYGGCEPKISSRAQTPLVVRPHTSHSNLPHPPSQHKCSTPRFQLAKIHSSLKNSSLLRRMPGEFPQDPSEEIDEKQESSKHPVVAFTKLSLGLTRLTVSPLKEGIGNASHTTSLRRNIPCPSTLPESPKLDTVQLATDKSYEYAIVLSMYEVYNDRIYDLLTGNAMTSKNATKDTRRRPLLFKYTEHSPDRKIVAGLRKIACGSLEEALIVLETGLTERRVAGTGSNAVSSRSHGFFSIEVKKKMKSSCATWQGATMTIVDLAGSERARTAKTAGMTLAEAGKINESLMYLGQCMQIQSDNVHLTTASDPHLVPFRQCKLTELLFSNMFSHRGGTSIPRHQQKATMIVTADPCGEYNATSQILRYSALARDVMVPRIPSVTQSIIYPSLSRHDTISPTLTGRSSTTLTNNMSEAEGISILQSEFEVLKLKLGEEVERRKAVEEAWALASAKTEQAVEEAEAAVRAECMDVLDQQLTRERARWANAREEEREANEKLIDDKIDILRTATEADEEEDDGGVTIYEDSWKDKFAVLEQENLGLLERVRSLENELRKTRRQNDTMRTPSRKVKPLKAKKWVVDDGDELAGSNDENTMPIV